MITTQYVRRMAEYNQWMNQKLLAAADGLSAEELQRDRGAFFGSIAGTLNHLLVADTVWLQRFAKHSSAYTALAPISVLPTPQRLNQILFTALADLRQRREVLDTAILGWAAAVTLDDLQRDLCFTNMKGIEVKRNYAEILMHFFNHQTHHRGQTTTLLTQAGMDVGVTDLLMLVPSNS